MNKSGVKYIVSILLILLSFLSIVFAFDAKLSLNIFGNFSIYTNVFFYNLFGNFSLLFLSSGFVVGIILFSKIKTINKIFIFCGYALIISFITVFSESFGILNLNSGYFGINISKLFIALENYKKFLLFFFWFFSGILLIVFPARSQVSIIIYNLLNKNQIKEKKKSSDTGINYGLNNLIAPHEVKKRVFPWLSKVVYENDNRLEIPVIPYGKQKIKKFVLINESDQIEEYRETENKDKEKLREEYFQNLKSDWPLNWKDKNEINDFEIIEDKNDLPLQPNLLPQPVIENKTGEKINSNTKERHKKIKIVNFMENEKFTKNNSSGNISLPETDILENEVSYNYSQFKTEHIESAKTLEETLLEFGIKAEVTEIIHGPVVTLFKLIPAAGIKLQKIESLSNNLALRLAAKSIRIIAPIPGEKVVGIEIPNIKRILVKFKEIVNNELFTSSSCNIPVGLGKDIYGNIIIIDLFKMPHILIAGATGAGKSVCVNAIISSILFAKNPNEVKFILIDPKIVELKPYNNIPHLLTPVITDPKLAINTLKYLIFEMERRYSVLDFRGARDIIEYKIKTKEIKNAEDLPFIVTIVDEFADLMSTSGKEAEILFARIAAKARAVGIHLVLATQRPSIDVITGLIKANVPARVAFQVISLQDSRIILDQKGAEKLLGQGDMLYLSPTHPYPIRLQGAFLSKNEVDLICDHWKSIAEPNYINIEDYISIIEESENENNYENLSEDSLFQQAIDIVFETQKASASYLQRRLSIGYNRAARMIEEMERMGIVGPQKGAKPREIIGARPSF